MNDRKEWIDYAKGIGIILVVYGHLLSNGYHDGLDIPGHFYELSRNILYSFHMPFFFLLSGLLAEDSLQKRGSREYVIDKLRRIAYPYFLWSTIQIIIEVIFSDHTQNGTTLSNLFTILYRPWGQFWFIYSLFFMHIIYAILSGTERFAKPALVIAGFVLFFNPLPATLVLFSNPLPIEVPILYQFSTYFMYFVFGIFFQRYFFVMEKLEIPPIFILLLLILLVSCGLLIYGDLIHQDPFTSFRYARFLYLYLSIVGIILCVSLAQYLARKNTLTFIRIFGFHSLQIYLVHMIAGAGTRLILSNYLHIQNWIIQISISVLVALISPILIQKISEKAGFPYFFELPKKREPVIQKQTQSTA
jgi:fucose 4-O-acetylase-like acetyltransferase